MSEEAEPIVEATAPTDDELKAEELEAGQVAGTGMAGHGNGATRMALARRPPAGALGW